MKLSDGLKAKIANLLDRMEALSKKAGDEQRLFDAGEAAAWDAAEREVKDLQAQLERQEKAEALARGDRGGAQPVTPGGPGLIAGCCGRSARPISWSTFCRVALRARTFASARCCAASFTDNGRA